MRRTDRDEPQAPFFPFAGVAFGLPPSDATKIGLDGSMGRYTWSAHHDVEPPVDTAIAFRRDLGIGRRVGGDTRCQLANDEFLKQIDGGRFTYPDKRVFER